MPWIDSLDADHQTHASTKGWDKMEPDAAAAAIVKAHRALEQHLGVPADQLLRLPKDATDPSYQGIYERVVGMSVPATADGYTFDGIKFKDGSTLEPEDVAFVRELGTKYKLPAQAVRGIAADLAARYDALSETDGTAAETAKAANQAALRMAWNTDYDQKAFSATKAAEAVGFTPEVLAHMASLSPEAYVKNMNALVLLGAQMQEATILRGGNQPADPTAGLSAEQAAVQKQARLGDPEFAKKLMAKDPTAWEEINKLDLIIVQARMGAR